MTPDQYVESILAKYAVPRGPNSPAERLANQAAGPLRNWAGESLNSLDYSGSYAKGTGVHGASDVDLFISLRPGTPNTLKEIYESLHSFCARQLWNARAQSVSIGVTIDGFHADLVPGRVQEGYQDYHSLWVNKRQTWTQTNVKSHIQLVQKSGRIGEIRAMKVWRLLHQVAWPSLYLELFTIEALSGRSRENLADNVLHALRSAASGIATTRIVDPANTVNVLSDELNAFEKALISTSAAQSARQQFWSNIIW